MLAEERTAWLRLALTPGLAPRTARTLLAEFGLPTVLFQGQAPHARLAPLCGAELATALSQAAAPQLAESIARSEQWLDASVDRALVTLADSDYPAGLLELADAPIVLYAQGRRALLGRPALAIVGSRAATHQGERNAHAFAAHLGHAGLCIVSGMAGGIDAAAHRGALETSAGTVAVLGTGADRVSPPGNRALAGEIARTGLLLSEFAIGTPALPHNFPRRNRLIAALSRGVLVVEAALHSGSLITARLAADLGREVFAIPGSIHSPLARGCHRLIRDGAKLVESGQDVLEELRWGRNAAPAAAAAPEDAPAAGTDGSAVLASLGHDPADADTIALRSGLDAGKTSATLLVLELEGRVERLPGNRYQRLR
jgi:DNA processing protein